MNKIQEKVVKEMGNIGMIIDISKNYYVTEEGKIIDIRTNKEV